MHTSLGYSLLRVMVYLHHSLYGLKQAPLACLERSCVVTPAGFSASDCGHVVFVNLPPCGRALPLLYVNDMIMTGDDPKYIAFLRSV
jgi:hypothetical protein